MNCEREKVFNYLSDLLIEEEKKELESHLLTCPLCQKYLREFQLLKEELKILEEAPPYSLFSESLRKRIERAKKKKIFTYTLTTASFLILLFIFLINFIKIKKEEDFLFTDDYETIIYNLSEKEEAEILKTLAKEIKTEELISLEENLYEDKDYYDLLSSLEKEELEYLVKNLKNGGER
jgi:hypothetical protein|uniref:Zinc-finger domain-containing protein n=1 Tax=candidate division WOR-3 bacterium TaxID=2052148 RepID=A0A7V6CMY7_UNCW3